MTVLIVDDDPHVRRLFGEVLSRAGFEVTSVGNGLDAFSALQEEVFEIILCDVSMPVLGGCSFFEQLEERFPAMASRVVFITGLVDEEATRRFLESTGQPFLGKPTEVGELVETIRRVGQRH